MTFAANERVRALGDELARECTPPAALALAAKAQRLYDLLRHRERHFLRPVMADRAMAAMLSLFLAELKGVTLTPENLSLINLFNDDEKRGVVDSLILAGLVARTGENPERRTVGLTPLGSARMRSFISDYPDI
ncbi:hypothetical protein [Sphingobium lignivorans]|uniref:Transcriptional regulator n=1 Tax=Sphingobium lignivorans TaxID=2735886 RepID=A0ABR6NCX8_9SPHN|nr:hypothetical protein [Sphingobium lignivorans]MBB5985136.1 hypothetical protein [Sphingobium lignivorans]